MSNIVEAAYADVEARRAEMTGTRPAGAMLTREELDGQAPEEPDTAPAPKREKKSGLGGKSYASLFRSGLDPERIEFEVGGNACWVDLVPMGRDRKADLVNRFAGAESIKNRGTELCEYSLFLVGATVTAFSLVQQVRDAETGELGAWERINSAATPSARDQQFRKMGDALDWWGDLVWECRRVNGDMSEAENPDPN